jgi:hypothetical protein
MYFEYGYKETEYLKRKDKRLGEAIGAIGHIYREVDAGLFPSVVHHIAGDTLVCPGEFLMVQCQAGSRGENIPSVRA